MTDEQILVLQVPYPEALREVEPSEMETRRMHAEADYSRMWLYLYEDIVKYGEITISYRYPVTVNGRYITDPSPIPRWDVPKLHMADTLFLFGAGREKRIYAIPPHTTVEPLEFEDHAFRTENFSGKRCARCGAPIPFSMRSSTMSAADGAISVLIPATATRGANNGLREPLIR